MHTIDMENLEICERTKKKTIKYAILGCFGNEHNSSILHGFLPNQMGPHVSTACDMAKIPFNPQQIALES